MLDKKDKRILYELDINSRQSFAEIGKKVLLPKTVVFHRLQSLKQKKILKGMYSLVVFSKLGFTQYKAYFKFHSLNPKKEKEIISYLIKKNYVVWVTSCRGRWDMAVTFIARDIVEFDKEFKEVLNRYGKYIQEKNVILVSYSPLYSRNYLVPEEPKVEFLYMESIEKILIDKIEEKILQILARDSRIPLTDIAVMIGETRDIVAYRIKKLEREKIILCHRALIDLSSIGYSLYKVILRLHNFSYEEELKLVSYTKQFPNVVQYLRLVGNWDFELELEVESEAQLYGIIQDIRKHFSKIIRDYEVLQIVEEHKVNYYPLGLKVSSNRIEV